MLGYEEITVDLSGKYAPHDRQILFHTSPRLYKMYGGAMGGGKTGAIINECIQLGLDYPGNAGLLLRKTWPSFRNTVLAQLEKFVDPDLVYTWNKNEKRITFINGSVLIYGGFGSKPEDWDNYMSGEFGFIGLDQAEDFTEKDFTMLSTRLRLNIPGINYHFLLTCNPSPGWLKTRFIDHPMKDSVFIPALPQDNLENLPGDYIDRMLDILGDNEKKALLEGSWDVVGDPDNVYSYHKLNHAMGRDEDPGLPIAIGIDPAWSGDDETAVALREGLRVTLPITGRDFDTMSIVGEVWSMVRERVKFWREDLEAKEIEIRIDSVGIGAGVYDRFMETVDDMEREFNQLEDGTPIGYEDPRYFTIYIIKVNGAAKPRDKTKFSNLRAEVHWSLKEILDSISIPNDRDMGSQFMAIKYKRNSAGLIEIIKKDDIKKTLGRSPDRAEAVLYAVAAVGSSAGFMEF